jgi:formylglycine-generating enzyme required for sulfatase activity
MHVKTMKTLTAAAALGVIVAISDNQACAQLPVIESLSSNGELIGKNLLPGSVATVEWASSVNGPWSSTWSGLDAVQVDTDGKILVKVPMFYRLRGEPKGSDPAGMVWIPPGTFTMGSPAREPGRLPDEGPQMQVTLTDGYWMGKHEVTQREFLAVMGSNPSYFQPPNLRDDPDRPVDSVDWHDAVSYCEKLTQQEGAAGRLPAGYEYQLPTEAQWEYACRAGTTTATAFGNSLSSRQANFSGTFPYNGGAIGPSLGRTTTVGSYPPNAWGLYDMHGNVWEWCADWMSASYPGGSVTDPMGASSGSLRVNRGGSWNFEGGSCRSARRGWTDPSGRGRGLGFRVALVRVR